MVFSQLCPLRITEMILNETGSIHLFIFQSNAVVAMDEEPGSPGPQPLQDQNGMEVVSPVQKSARLAQTEAALKEQSKMLKAKEKVRVDLAELTATPT